MNKKAVFPLIVTGLGGCLFWESLSSGHTIPSALIIGTIGVALVVAGCYLQSRLFHHQPKV